MRGSTRKRGSAWTAYWDAGDDPATGKRRQKSNGGFKRQKDAEAHLATVIGQVNAGTYVEPTKTTFGAYALQWLDVQRSRLKPSTHESYTAVLTGRVIPEFGALPLERVTTSAVDALYAKLLREGRADAKGRLTARSVRYTHTVLRRAMRDAVRKRLIAHDPTDAADPPSPSAAKARRCGCGAASRSAGFSGRCSRTACSPRGGSPPARARDGARPGVAGP
jgi:hypothetical protein